MKKSLLKFLVFHLIILLSTSNVFAQFPGNENTTGNLENTDNNVAPINDFIIPMLMIAILISIHILIKKPEAFNKK